MNTGGKAGKEDRRSGQSWEAGSTVKVLAAHVTRPQKSSEMPVEGVAHL